MSLFGDLSDLVNKQKIDQQKMEDNRLKILTAAKKAETDAKKVEIEARKAQGQQDVADAALALDAQKVVAESELKQNQALGQSIDNTQKKLEVLSPQEPAVSPAGAKPAQKAEGAKPLPTAQADKAYAAPAERELPEVPVATWKPAPIETKPLDIESLVSDRKERQDAFVGQGMEEIEKMGRLRESYRKARNDVFALQVQTQNMQRSFAENPPTFKRALADIGWAQKIIGVTHALTAGYLQQNPTALIDQYANEELFAMREQYKARGAALAGRQTLYSQYMGLLKDDFKAEMATKNTLLDFIQKNIQIEANNFAKDANAVRQLEEFNFGLEMQKEANNRAMMQDFNNDVNKKLKEGVEVEFGGLRKGGGFGSVKLKRERKFKDTGFEKLMSDTFSPLSRSDVRKDTELDLKLTEHTANIGGFIDDRLPKASAKEIKKKFNTSGKTIIDLRDVERLAKDLKPGDLKAAVGPLAYLSSSARASRAKIRRLNDRLKHLSLNFRIDATGGGNMSEYEQKMLETLFSYTRGGSIRRTIGAISKWGKGDYNSLVVLVRKATFNNALATAEQHSSKFKSLSWREKYARIGKQLNMDSSVVEGYYNDLQKYGKKK